MRSAANILLGLAVIIWTAAFFFGPGHSSLWTAGNYAPVAAGVGLFIHIFTFVLPSSRAPKISSRKVEVRKCKTCGRPAVSDSEYCRYHTDEQQYMNGGS